MLSEAVKNELHKYNQEKKAATNLLILGSQKSMNNDNPENPETDLDNHHPDDSYPMQDSDIEEFLETHGHDSAKMASSCQAFCFFL